MGEGDAASARNYAAGSLRQADPKATAGRRLVFLAHDVVGASLAGASYAEKRAALAAWGFDAAAPSLVVDVDDGDLASAARALEASHAGPHKGVSQWDCNVSM